MQRGNAPSITLAAPSNGCAGLAAHSCGFPPLVGCIISSILPSAVSTAVAACREYAGNMQGICREYAVPGHSCQVHSVLSNPSLTLEDCAVEAL